MVSFISMFEQVFDILKASVIKNFKDEQLLQGSDLMKTLVPDCSSVAQMILDTVRNRSEHETFTEINQKSCKIIVILQNSKSNCIVISQSILAAHNVHHL